jgi:hypothetical protein
MKWHKTNTKLIKTYQHIHTPTTYIYLKKLRKKLSTHSDHPAMKNHGFAFNLQRSLEIHSKLNIKHQRKRY